MWLSSRRYAAIKNKKRKKADEREANAHASDMKRIESRLGICPKCGVELHGLVPHAYGCEGKK